MNADDKKELTKADIHDFKNSQNPRI